MGKKGSLTYQIQRELQGKLAPGVKKYDDKKSGLYGKGKSDPDKIYSFQTFENYMKISNRFAKWAKELHGCRDLNDLKPHAAEWLQSRERTVAASTVHQETAALAKLFGCSMADLMPQLPIRARGDFVKNRGDQWKGHYSKELHHEITTLSEGAGLRRHEMKRVTPDQVKRHDDGRIWIDGVKGKGGKIRNIPVRRGYEEQILALAEEAKAAGNDRLLSESIPTRAPIHADRGLEYAKAIYEEYARPIEDLAHEEIYFGRKDLKGRRWDKAALLKASEALGHRRLNVMANYLR